MKVKVDPCYDGKSYFLLTFPDGNRERIRSEIWTRKQAKEALDICEYVYGFTRKSVRFIHR